ncbi:MAG: AAA-like domain-containing protein [Ardenticatenaceae bacterium]
MNKIGRYIITKKLGEGGMAMVYLAHDPMLRRDVALKLLRADLAEDDDLVTRFCDEATTAAGLQHPNIIEVYDFGNEGGHYYLTMPFLSNRTLRHLFVKEAPFSLEWVASFLLPIADALDQAHEINLVHRDIKPTNILMDERWNPILSDFGIALIIREVKITRPGTVLGTDAYMSPEQAAGDIATKQADIYSLGIVLYEAITGKVPFKGIGRSIWYQHLHMPPPSLRSINPHIPLAVENVILKALAKTPEARFDSAGQMAEAMWMALYGQKPPTVLPGLVSPQVVIPATGGVFGWFKKLWDFINPAPSPAPKPLTEKTEYFTAPVIPPLDDSKHKIIDPDRPASYQTNIAEPSAPPVTPEPSLLPTEMMSPSEVGYEQPTPPPVPSVSDSIEPPGGAVSGRLYIERDADTRLKNQMIKRNVGTLTTIRAARQTGKSSLLAQGIRHARQHEVHVVDVDMQRVGKEYLQTPEHFLRYLAKYIVSKLRLDMNFVAQAWDGPLGPQDKLTILLEDYVLPASDKPIMLAMDEVDRLLETDFHTDFFGLIRSWHNSRAFDDEWRKLNIVLVISTEPHLLIADVNQSPFNVGLRLSLEDFNEAQVHDLNQRHGSPLSSKDIPKLMELLNGHPYLTRQGLYTLVTQPSLSWTDVTMVSLTDQGPFAEHLQRYNRLLRDQPILRAGLRQVINENRCPDEMILYRLLRAGLVTGTSSSCTCRCNLYRMFFRGKL